MSHSSLPSDSSFHPLALQLFFEFQDRLERGESPEFTALCVAHPQFAEQFHAMRDLAEFAAGMKPAPLAGQAPDAWRGRVASGDHGPHSNLFERLRSGGVRSERYRMLGEVARGGMGAILRIWDDELRRTLAMKVVLGKGESVSGETPDVDPRTLGRFLEEAQITGQLDHPGIVPVHELGLDASGRVYFTMKLVKGEDLKTVFEHVKTGHDGWSELRALNVMLRVCEAVAYAHAKNVIHRDLKPANVMVGKFGEVYVMDWGLARVVGQEDRHDLRIQQQEDEPPGGITTEREDARATRVAIAPLTRDGDVLGTPNYMPPEQAHGRLDDIGPHSDVYAIGAMLYQLVTGRPPYASVKSHYAILECVRRGAPTPTHELAPQAVSELVAIVEKAMARAIPHRYRNTVDLGDDLRAYLEGRVVHAYETGAWAEAKKWVKRNKSLASSIAAVVLAVVVGGIAFAVKAREATNARDDVARKNTELESINEELEKARTDAVANAEQATLSERAAQAARLEAERKANDVLSLSAQKDHDDLVAEAANLWPARPEMIPAYEDWLRRAKELIDGRPADEAKGLKKRPSLVEHQSKLEELRRDAKPLSDTEILADRMSHPRRAELEAKQAELLWRSRMLGLDAWPSESEIENSLESDELPIDAADLNLMAWVLVDPAKPAYGQEVRALLLARLAVAASSEENRYAIRDTLAWALLSLGRFDEALNEERMALSEPGGEALMVSASDLQKAVDAWRGDELAIRRNERDKLSADVVALTLMVNERRTYEFDDPEKEWWNRQLVKLVSDIEALRDPNLGLMNDVLAGPFGWGVAKRYEFAKAVGERSVDGPEAKHLWAEAITAIESSPKYGGLKIVAQMGLLPLGMDPNSQLWEFAHLQTGEPAVRGADGKLVLTEETGIVFVLFPAGKFWMGAQNKPGAQNHDPQARGDEAPVHEVELSPYFLSKYEMTQGQWQRIAATNPSFYKPPSNLAPTLLHPVEQVSWTMCFDLLDELGLLLPTEAQWECGARAGTTTPWWAGQERESLRGNVNIADLSAQKDGASWTGINDWPDLEDGSVAHCAVGKFAPNGFGLHEVAGNVWEWCLDGKLRGFYGENSGIDPLSSWSNSPDRMARGGSFFNAASYARSAYRNDYPPEYRGHGLGLRPARTLHRSSLHRQTPR